MDCLDQGRIDGLPSGETVGKQGQAWGNRSPEGVRRQLQSLLPSKEIIGQQVKVWRKVGYIMIPIPWVLDLYELCDEEAERLSQEDDRITTMFDFQSDNGTAPTEDDFRKYRNMGELKTELEKELVVAFADLVVHETNSGDMAGGLCNETMLEWRKYDGAAEDYIKVAIKDEKNVWAFLRLELSGGAQ